MVIKLTIPTERVISSLSPICERAEGVYNLSPPGPTSSNSISFLNLSRMLQVSSRRSSVGITFIIPDAGSSVLTQATWE